jgi:hypothetical protein
MKIVWNQTGDWLGLTPANHELALYWVHKLDQDNINVFRLEHNYFDLSWPTSLQSHVQAIDNFLTSKLKIDKLSVFCNQDLIDQSVLNNLHRIWICLIQDYPKLVQLIAHDSNLYHHWNQINKKIHYIEEGFKSLYISKQYWETPNIFSTDILNFNICQIKLNFSQKGRNTFNKWKMSDYNIVDRDTDDFSNFGSEVLVSLEKPESCDPPREYVEFCRVQNISLIGNHLNLANFENYETNLKEIRHVYLRNIANENNTASFKF